MIACQYKTGGIDMEYTIRNDRLTARADTHGAELHSLKTARDREILWQADPAVWARYAPVCFPWCGKVQDGWFDWQGERRAAPTQHGFLRDVEHTLVSRDENRMTFRFDWPGDGEGWLWPFRFETEHRLRDNTLLTTCTVSNTGSEAMPAQLGFHPGFLCPFVAGSAIEEYEVRFASGLVVPLEPHLFDHDSIPYTGVGPWARLTHRPTGKYIEVGTDGFDRTLLWSKPGIPGYVCIEPWCGFPGPQHDLFARPHAISLAPGERRSWTQRVTVAF